MGESDNPTDTVEEVTDFVAAAPRPPTNARDPQIVAKLQQWGIQVQEWVTTEIERRVG